jgi:hypothetical protein
MRYIAFALALCFALPSVPAMAANKPVKHKARKVKHFKPHKVTHH